MVAKPPCQESLPGGRAESWKTLKILDAGYDSGSPRE